MGLLLLGFFVVVGVVAPLLYPGDPNSLPTDYNVLYGCQDPSPPTISTSPWVLGPHPFGETAHLGLDVAWSLLLGTRWDLLFLAIIIGVSVLVGSLLGAAAGAVGGWTETVLGPVFDGVLSFPPFLVVLLVPVVAALPGASSWLKTEAFVVAMLAVLWAPFAQGVRAKSRMLVRQPFVEAARAAGARWPRILWRHILPNSMAPVLAQIPATIFSVLFTLGAYQYLGLISNGTPRCGYKTDPAGSFLFLPSYHFPEWTWTMANGVTGYFPPGFGVDDWWAYLIPSAWILLFILAVTLVCDGLVGHLDPYLRH
ncbi:MAG: ABC transporter permease subunit [Euryarchaeota archaeon]|nr:ABC transporter permease subunit [Euryarchaeota archaeon]MDE1836856.1 ABC transporter permease subunit [Euryarchaeota archaeon]MDE1879735.1 ABC transporter permease subunit [Euryarchaeota archaeon]MDE2046042.1 ABC transporter permease subunit [Thermoplasmata archaeon]